MKRVTERVVEEDVDTPRPMAPALSLPDIRAILSDEIDRIRSGKTTPEKANAVSNAAGKILSSVRLELQYAKMAGRVPKVEMLEAGVERRE